MNIKKIIAGLSAFATAFTLCTAIDGNTLSASDATYYIVGDANEDDKLNVRDAACIARALAKNKTKTLPKSADYTQDGIINVRDAAGIARYCAKSHSSDKPLTTVPVTQPAETTATETTTTTVATQTTEETETNSVTSTNQNIIETEVTTEVSINELPVETVTTTTTVTTTNEPVETTTVTTTTQVAETTVSENVENILDNYIIYYNIKPILEEHSISHNEEVNETKWFHDWNNGKYPDYTVEALTERYGENFNGVINANTALHQWYIDVIGKNHAGWFTRWNIIGWEYELQVIGDKRNSPVVAMSVEDFTAATGIELPLSFTSSRLVDADSNVHDAWEDGRSLPWGYLDDFWSPTSIDLPDYGYYNVIEHLDELMNAPVIYYR